jgi:integrase
VKALLQAKRTAGYSANTVRLVKASLSAILTDATDDGHVPVNVTLGAGRRKGRAQTPATGEQIRPLTRAERDRFMVAAARDWRTSTLFETLFKAGLRPGEGMALRPDDLDLKGFKIRVQRSLTDDGDEKGTKTGRSRVVDMTPSWRRPFAATWRG